MKGGGAAQLDRAEAGRVVVNSHVHTIQYYTRAWRGLQANLAMQDVTKRYGKKKGTQEKGKKKTKQQKPRPTR